MVRLFFIKIECECVQYEFQIYCADSESENEESEDETDAHGGNTFGDDDDTIGNDQFLVNPPKKRRVASKQKWITPRLCSALDKAKVKRMRLCK